MKIKYIENDIKNGIDYDLKTLVNEYKALSIPKDVFKPPLQELENHKYIIELSERSTGKTTNWLLFGLCMNKHYGTIVQYVRAKESMLAPKFAVELVTVINEYKEGYYIKKLTDNRYNSLTYHWSKFYYANIDENGKIIERSEKHCIQCLSVDKNADYKSGYNAPLGDCIIFDEFISKYYSFNECIDFFDLCSTIIRKRKSPFVIMLANTINLNSPYFEEFEIAKEVRKAKKGIPIRICTEYGTRIFFEIIDTQNTKVKEEHNRLFFGFKNPKLSAITGQGTWAVENVPHIPDIEYETVERRLYIELNNFEYLQVEVIYEKEIGNALFVHRGKEPKKDSVVLTLSSERKNNYFYGLGNKKIRALILSMLSKRQVFYSSNEVGSDFKNFVRMACDNQYDLK